MISSRAATLAFAFDSVFLSFFRCFFSFLYSSCVFFFFLAEKRNTGICLSIVYQEGRKEEPVILMIYVNVGNIGSTGEGSCAIDGLNDLRDGRMETRWFLMFAP